MKKYLILVLEGPMQSWGLQGKFDHRDTTSFPTKSGVVGLLGSALGIERNDRLHIAELASFEMSTIALKRGVILNDYHTVGCGYKNNTSRILQADGKGYSQAVTHRDYLCDASFAVILYGDSKLADRCAVALDNPKWSTYLGRRCCIPTRPILEAVVETKAQVKKILNKLGVKGDSRCQSDGLGRITQQDVPIDFKKREYGVRSVVEESQFI